MRTEQEREAREQQVIVAAFPQVPGTHRRRSKPTTMPPTTSAWGEKHTLQGTAATPRACVGADCRENGAMTDAITA